MLRHHAVQCLIRSVGKKHLAGTRDAPFVDICRQYRLGFIPS
jgi:hypothetical protein